MNWNPLRRISRHGSKSDILQADEIVLKKHASKLEQLENSTKKLYKDAKKYEEIILQVNECEKKITNDLCHSIICQEEKDLRTLLEEWHTFVSEITQIDDDLVLVIHRAIIEPLKKFQGVFSEAKAAIKRHDQSLQECNKLNHKLQRLQEKDRTGQNIVRIQNAKQNLESSLNEFKGHDNILQTELPQLYEGRIEYFQPSLEALIKSQVQHSGDTAQMFTQVLPKLNEFTQSETDYHKNQTQRLRVIQALSIVADK